MSIELSNRRRLVWDWSNLLHNDLRLRIVDTLTGAEICVLEGHTDMVRHALELQGGGLLTWSNDQTLRIWRMSDGHCDTVFREHRGWISDAIEAWPGIILSWDGHGWLHCWSTATGASLNQLEPLVGTSPHDSDIHAVLPADGDRVLVVTERHVRLVRASVAPDHSEAWPVLATLSIAESGRSRDVVLLPPAHFLIHDDDRASVRTLENGRLTTIFDLRGYETKVLPLRDGRLLLLHWSRRTKRHVIDLWELPPAGRLISKLIATLEFDGERVARFVQQADGEVLLALNDYRVFLLGTRPLALRREAALAADGSSGFLSFDPEVAEIAEPMPGGPQVRHALRAHWLSDADTGLMALSPNRYLMGEPVHGGRLLLAIDEGGYELFDPATGRCEAVSTQAHKAIDRRALDRSACTRAAIEGRSKSVQRRMAQLSGVAPEAVTEALAPLGEHYQERGQRLWLIPAEDGAIVGWQREPEPAAWWIARKAGGDTVEVLPIAIDATQFEAFNGCPLIAPDGTVHALRGGRLAPLTRPGSNDTLRALPAYRDQLPFLRWCAGNRILARDFDGVAVHDAASLERITRLDGGHGVAIRGIHELRDGTLVTYSRSALRSWRAADLSPLVELRILGTGTPTARRWFRCAR